MAKDTVKPTAEASTPRARGKRRCHALNKRGGPCMTPPLKGTHLCGMHTPGWMEKQHKKLREMEAAGTVKRGTLRKPREIDLLIAKLEEHADEVVRGLVDMALNAEKAVVVQGTRDEPGHVEMVPDYDLRLKAVKELYDRVHGKAFSSVKLGGIEGGEPIAVDVPRGQDRAKQVAEILARQGALRQGATPHEGRRRAEGRRTNGASVQPE